MVGAATLHGRVQVTQEDHAGNAGEQGTTWVEGEITWSGRTAWQRIVGCLASRRTGEPPLRAVLMGTKSCTKILILPKIFPTRFRFTFYG